MFSKNYFNYLLKSKKYLLIFIFLITLLNIFSNRHASGTLEIQGVLSLILCYVLPVYFFYYVHDKKAVDSYYSIPVSRKAVVCTGIIFTIAVIFLPLLLTLVVYGIKTSIDFLPLLYYFALMLVLVATLIIFNTTIYLVANNVFDGVVMIGAYTILPLALWGMANSLLTAYVAGISYYDLSIVAYLSPVYMSGYSFLKIFQQAHDYSYLIALIVYLIVFTILLLVGYKKRDVARANTPSSKFFAYPLVIYIYVFISMFTIATENNYNYKSIIPFLKDNLILYVLLFVIFVAAHFVYKRKLYISYKLPLFFIIAMIISLTFTTVFKNNEGFGLSQRYVMSENMRYNYNVWDQDDKQILALLNEKNEEHSDGYSVFIEAANYENSVYLKHKETEFKDETVEFFENIRQAAIHNFYHGTDKVNSSFTVEAYENREAYLYYYSLENDLDYQTLVKLAQDENVDVFISADYGYSYYLQADGTLSLER